jgi:hypothetical protein
MSTVWPHGSAVISCCCCGRIAPLVLSLWLVDAKNRFSQSKSQLYHVVPVTVVQCVETCAFRIWNNSLIHGCSIMYSSTVMMRLYLYYIFHWKGKQLHIYHMYRLKPLPDVFADPKFGVYENDMEFGKLWQIMGHIVLQNSSSFPCSVSDKLFVKA